MKSQSIKREYLTPEEIKAIVQVKLPVPRLDKVRDIFLFSCFTFLALIDNHLIIKVLRRVTY